MIGGGHMNCRGHRHIVQLFLLTNEGAPMGICIVEKVNPV